MRPVDIDLEAFYLVEEEEEEEVFEEDTLAHPFEEINRQCRELSREMESWRESAPCFGKYQWSTATKVKISDKKFIELCTGCSFKRKCLLVAICYRDEELIWGGAKPDERRKIVEALVDEKPDIFRYWRDENLDIVTSHIDNYYRSQAKEVRSDTP